MNLSHSLYFTYIYSEKSCMFQDVDLYVKFVARAGGRVQLSHERVEIYNFFH